MLLICNRGSQVKVAGLLNKPTTIIHSVYGGQGSQNVGPFMNTFLDQKFRSIHILDRDDGPIKKKLKSYFRPTI